jgi:intein/homing endonuclease/superfamily II DNA or RNA helicase
MANFGTLEYVLDKFSGTWSWKITGERAVAMVSRIMPQAWYGEGEYEAIVPDDPKHVRQIKWIMDRYPLEILSKNVWQKKLPPSAKQVTKKPKKIERLNLANPGKQFKGILFNFQREGLDFLIKSSGNALLADEMGLGKCIVGTSLIETINGQVPISELWKNSSVIERDGDEEWAKLSKPITIQTFDGQKITGKKITRIFRQKISEPIAQVTLWDGSVIECTKRHRFLTPDGWKMAWELTINDKVAVPAKTLHAGKNKLEPELAELMAWQLAEGYDYYTEEGHPQGIFNNSDPTILSRVRDLAKKHGIKLREARRTRNTFVIYTTKLHSLFSKWGYHWGKRSAEKIIPKCVLESTLEAQKAFVQAMFDAEGHVGKTHYEFCTASKDIADGMHYILRHFGIWLRIRIAFKYATNGTKIKRPYYICTFGGNSIERFVKQFKLYTKRKQHALESLAKKRHNTNIEDIPSQKIVQKIAKTDVSLRSLNLFTQYKYTQGMSKNLAYLVINKSESTNHTRLARELQKLANEAIHWCDVKEIQIKQFHGYVYDLSVPVTHNYVVNGIITHNTIQSLAYLSTEKNAFPVLIVAPLVTLQNWQREIEKFLKRKSRNGRLLDNEPPTSTIIRVGKSEELGKFDFYIINYELLYKRYKDLAKLNLKTIVCDEVQHLRSKTTQKYHAVKKLSALSSVKYRIGLSGTPIYNRGSEIWPIVDILRPGLLGNFKEFCEYFCYINEKGKAIVLENKRESLRHMLQKHVMLRRKKSDVLTELKEKVRYKEIIDADINYYNTELEKIWKKLEEERKEAQTAFDASTAYQRAIQSERQAAGIAKLPHVINFVKNIMEIEESVVVFCHHKSIHSLLHQSLAEFKPASIIGGQSDKERQANIDSFQNGETKLMIAGLRAGNVGINLTRAKYVIFAELDWSPAIHLQGEDRLHRLGQKNTVFAYYLIGNGTLDEHVAQVLVDKSYEIDSIMDSKAESFENRDKAKLILAQIQDKIKSITRN